MKFIIPILLFWLPVSTVVLAQDTTSGMNAEISVSANVLQSIELITVQNIRLNDIEQQEGQYYVSPVENNDAGHMIAIGNPNADIRITFQQSQILSQSNGNGIININYELSGNDTDDQVTSEILNFENRNLRFNQEGRFYIWVGGNITFEQFIPGVYEGEFTIEIDYI